MDRKIRPRIFNATDFTLKLQHYTYLELNNKLPVYIINAGKEEVLSIEFVFLAGNSFENKNMIAASTNFLLKNGTTRKNAYEINDFFDYYGSFLNRKCYNETAVLSLHCLSKHTEILLPVLAEILNDSIFPEEEINIYVKNSKQKLNINLSKAEFIANRIIDANVFGQQHPYGKYSTHEALDAINREDLLSFYNNHYKNGNCLLFVSGCIPQNIESLLEKYFGHLPFQIHPYKNINFNYTIDSSKDKKVVIKNDEKASQGSIRIARLFPMVTSQDYTKAMVMNTIFGGYFGSRLMSNIREDKGYTYGIHSFVQNHIKESSLLIATEAGKNVCEATIEEVWKEARKMREQPVLEEELHLVKNYLIGSILSEIDGPFEIMSRWKNYILHNVDDSYFYKSIETIKNITINDVQEMSKKYLKEEDFWTLIVY